MKNYVGHGEDKGFCRNLREKKREVTECKIKRDERWGERVRKIERERERVREEEIERWGNS